MVSYEMSLYHAQTKSGLGMPPLTFWYRTKLKNALSIIVRIVGKRQEKRAQGISRRTEDRRQK